MVDIRRLGVFGSLAVVVALGTAGNVAGASSDRRVLRPGADRGTECPDGRRWHDDCHRDHRSGSDKREAKERRKAEEREERKKARHEGKKEKKKHHDKKKSHKSKHYEKKQKHDKKDHEGKKHYEKKQHHKKKHHDTKHYDKKHHKKHHKKRHYEKNVILVFQPGGGGGPKPKPPDRQLFVVHLMADQQNPAGASGVANLLLDLDENELCFYVAYHGLAGATVAHLHRRVPGAPDPLVLDLGPTFSGGRDCFDADEDALEDIADDPGDHYLHLHTLPNLDVAVRGQLARPFNL